MSVPPQAGSSRVGPPIALLALLSVLVPACSPARGNNRSASPGPQQPLSPESPGADFYVAGNERITLHRSPSEIVVAVAGGATREGLERALRERYAGLQIREEIANAGRVYYLLVLPGTSRTELQRTWDALRLDSLVSFAGPVFLDPATSGRMIPTDQVIARLKPGVSRAQLDSAAAGHSLVVSGNVPGTSLEFVLRLADPKDGTALGRARTLHATGLFEWVQPDFIRELQRGAL